MRLSHSKSRRESYMSGAESFRTAAESLETINESLVTAAESSEKTGEVAVTATASEQPSSEENGHDSGIEYPGIAKLVVILCATALAVFLVALDTSIISTAIPQITDDFHSVQDVGWYGSGYFMTIAAFQTVWGKAYKFWRIKPVYLLSIFIFEVGSLICAVAPNSTTLIVGRAVAGVGSGGIVSGCYLIVGVSAPPTKTPALQGINGASFAIASIVGPLLGGAFTTYASWRWCFWINLPFGGVTAALVILFYRNPAHMRPGYVPVKEKILQMDPLGATILLAAFTCLFLALQKGGVTNAWNSSVVLGTLIGSFVLFAVFAATEYFLGQYAAIQGRFLRNKTMAFQFMFQMLVAGSFYVLLYYLPIYFQAVSSVSAASSGVRTIPLVATGSISVIVVGIWISATGEYQLAMIVGTAFTTVGSGLIYTLDVGTPAAKWIGYQIIAGIGVGITVQIAVVVCQGFASLQDISTVSALTLFWRLSGGAVWISVSQSIFSNTLVKAIERDIPGVSAETVVGAGATELRQVLPSSEVAAGINAYMEGLRNAYAVSIALGCTAFVLALASVFLDRRNLKEAKRTDNIAREGGK